MSTNFYCHDCSTDLSDLTPDGFDAIGEEVICPNCGSMFNVEYDESLDENGDEHCHFWLTRSDKMTQQPIEDTIKTAIASMLQRADELEAEYDNTEGDRHDDYEAWEEYTALREVAVWIRGLSLK